MRFPIVDCRFPIMVVVLLILAVASGVNAQSVGTAESVEVHGGKVTKKLAIEMTGNQSAVSTFPAEAILVFVNGVWTPIPKPDTAEHKPQIVNAEPALPAFFSVSVSASHAGRLGYRVPGTGAVVSAGIPLRSNFYLTEDLTIADEHKIGLEEGRTISSVTGINYYLEEGNGGHFFGRAALQIAQHDNELFEKSVTRAQLGAGWEWRSASSGLPLIQLTTLAQIPLSDQNNSWGAITNVGGFYQLPGHAVGFKWKAGASIVNVRDSLEPRRGWAGYGSVEAGLFVNLSALLGH